MLDQLREDGLSSFMGHQRRSLSFEIRMCGAIGVAFEEMIREK